MFRFCLKKWKRNSCNIMKCFIIHGNESFFYYYYYFFFFFVTWLTEILETKIFTCSFQCPCIKYTFYFGINESLMTIWLAYIALDSYVAPALNTNKYKVNSFLSLLSIWGPNNFQIGARSTWGWVNCGLNNIKIRRYLASGTLQFWYNLTKISFQGKHFNYFCVFM